MTIHQENMANIKSSSPPLTYYVPARQGTYARRDAPTHCLQHALNSINQSRKVSICSRLLSTSLTNLHVSILALASLLSSLRIKAKRKDKKKKEKKGKKGQHSHRIASHHQRHGHRGENIGRVESSPPMHKK